MISTHRTAGGAQHDPLTLGIAGLAGAVAQANPGLPEGRQPAKINPADFTTTIDNPYYPLRPGDRRVYRETAPDGTRQKIVDVVTNRTKRIANGVTARVILATVTDQQGQGRGVHGGMVRPGPRRQRLVLRRRHDRVRERKGQTSTAPSKPA